MEKGKETVEFASEETLRVEYDRKQIDSKGV